MASSKVNRKKTADLTMITLRLDPELLRQFDEMAASLECSRTHLLRVLIRQSIELRELKSASLLDITADRIADKLYDVLAPLIKAKGTVL